jgi:hypothetical protein
MCSWWPHHRGSAHTSASSARRPFKWYRMWLAVAKGSRVATEKSSMVAVETGGDDDVDDDDDDDDDDAGTAAPLPLASRSDCWRWMCSSLCRCMWLSTRDASWASTKSTQLCWYVGPAAARAFAQFLAISVDQAVHVALTVGGGVRVVKLSSKSSPSSSSATSTTAPVPPATPSVTADADRQPSTAKSKEVWRMGITSVLLLRLDFFSKNVVRSRHTLGVSSCRKL